ncbi:MAG: IS3 family transposase [Coriobacteriia bacterium]
MHSYEDRIKAVELYIQSGFSPKAVFNALGYPCKNSLRRWYREYLDELAGGERHDRYRRKEKYTCEQKQTAVQYYLEHGRSRAKTVRDLGYPCAMTLAEWIAEIAPDTLVRRRGGGRFSREEKQDAVIALSFRQDSAQKVADAVGVTRAVLYKWRNSLLGEESADRMDKTNSDDGLPDDKEALESEVECLKKQIRRLKMERDILEGTVEIVKKDPGADPKNLTNVEKTLLIDALKTTHRLVDLREHLGISKSSYFYCRAALSREDKYAEARGLIAKLFDENARRYGYRRMHALLRREGVTMSEKVVRRIMSEEGLIVPVKRRRGYSSYRGETSPAPDNLLERDFHASAPNVKWLTDITEFRLPAGTVYLSPVIDCFDGMVVSWTAGTSPNADLVNEMLDLATETLGRDERPVIHSDRGCHYRWPAWIERVEKAGLKRSMSKKGCSPDNSACEGFFGRLKNEMFYGRLWQDVSIEGFLDVLDSYMRWYNETRIKMSLGGLSPLEYRRNLGLAA